MTEIITSPQNRYVAEAKKLKQKKYRDALGLYMAEGLRLCEEAVKTKEVYQAFVHETLASDPRGEALLKAIAGTGCELFFVTGRVLEQIADTDTPQGVVLVLKKKKIDSLYDMEKYFDFTPPTGGGRLVVALDGVSDPGNLGTLARTLWCAGGSGLIALKGSTDPYGPKAVRASMGGMFNISVAENISWDDTVKWAHEKGYTIVAADIHDAMDYRKYTWPEKVLLVIGNEARGLISAGIEDIDQKVIIPLAPGAESLNASVAGGILIYEAIR